MSTEKPLVTLKLSIQVALLGEVTSRLVSVTCGLKDRRIQIRAYVSGKVGEEELERLGFIGAEVIADFPEGYTIEESCLSIDDAAEEMLDFWAFRRAGDKPMDNNA
jgi:hypothetical protein